MRLFVLLLILLSTTSANAQWYYEPGLEPCDPGKHGELPSLVELPYSEAREVLIKAGWQPVLNYNFGRSQEPFGMENTLLEKGYGEVQSCAGTGLAPCRMHFSDPYGSHLVVTTIGEFSDSYEGGVANYVFVCKPAQ